MASPLHEVHGQTLPSPFPIDARIHGRSPVAHIACHGAVCTVLCIWPCRLEKYVRDGFQDCGALFSSQRGPFHGPHPLSGHSVSKCVTVLVIAMCPPYANRGDLPVARTTSLFFFTTLRYTTSPSILIVMLISPDTPSLLDIADITARYTPSDTAETI